MNYRLLDPKEWSRLDSLVNGQGPIPSPEAAVAAVAETDEGELVGVLFVQMVFHMEPLAISPEHKGVVSFKSLHGVLEEELDGTPYFAFSDTPQVGKMCKLVGLKQLPYRVWSKETSQSLGQKEN